MHRRTHSRTGITRPARVSAPALLAAAGLAIVFAGVVGYFALTGQRTPRPAGASPSDVPAPDIRVINSGQNASGGNLVGILSGGSGFFMQVADKDDPSRVAAEITADTSEPIEGSRYRMEQPRAWIFLDDGRTVAIQAAKGQARIPNQRNSRPEEGTLEGDVVIRLFDAKPDGQRPDVEKDRAVLVARTPRVQFDATTGELLANDTLTIEGDQVDFAGAGMTLVYSEAAQRVELLRIVRSDHLIIKPGAHRERTARAGAANPPTPTPTPGTGAAAGNVAPAEASAKQPVETLYALTARDNVHVVYGGRDATADLLEGWARLIDNKLPEGVLGAVRTGASGAGAASGAPVSGAASGVPVGGVPVASTPTTVATDVTTGAATAARGGEEEPVTITWSGMLEVRPVASSEMLARDHVAIALSSPAPDGVVVTDEASGARAMGSRVAYATTTREVSISGQNASDPADMGQWAVVASAKSGQLRAPRMQFSLATGVAQLAGPGWICPDATVLPDQVAQAIAGANEDRFAQAGIELPTERVPATVAWSRDAEFTFATDRDNRITGVLKRVLMTGDVVARDEKGSLNADSVTASFLESTSHGAPASASAGAGAGESATLANPLASATSSRLAHIQAVGNAQILDMNGGGATASAGIAARQIDIAFNPTTRETTPASIDAQGTARAWRDETSLRAGSINAALSRDDEGDLIATNLVALSSVEFDNGTVAARCDKLVADPVAQTADLTGYATRITSGTSTVAGSVMHLDGVGRTLEVVGAGTFAHADPASADGTPVRTANASWTKSMKFDDAKGVLDCEGETTATMSQGLLAKDHVWADRVVARFDRTQPDASVASTDPLAPVPAVTNSDRTLTIIEAFGTDGGTGANGEAIAPAPAKFEFRRYAQDASTVVAQPPLERLLFLEAPYLIANNTMGTIDANGQGRLLIVDHTDQPRANADTSKPLAVNDAAFNPGSFRGDALFNWTDSLALDRREGSAVMRGSTRLVHRDPSGGTFAQIEGDTLTARVREETVEAPLTLDTPFVGQFMGATVEGSAWLRHNNREMVADTMSYDAATRIVDAIAKPGRMVTLMSPNESTPTSAQRITWDLAKDRVDVKRLSR